MSQMNYYMDTVEQSKRNPTVEIYMPGLYEKLKKHADKNGMSLRQWVNEEFENMIKKDIFLETHMPKLKKLGFGDGKIIIMDSVKKSTAFIGLLNGVPFCQNCEKDNCPHVIYAMTQSELADLTNFEKDLNMKTLPKIESFDINEDHILLHVKKYKKPIKMSIIKNHLGNIITCNHCTNPDCYFRNFILQNKEFYEFLRKFGIRVVRLRP